MEIEVGEYVRTKSGYIRKVVDTAKNHIIIAETISYGSYGLANAIVSKEAIAKHSKNIPDLIEVGDYVNGQEVVTIYGYDEDGIDKDELGIIETDDDFAYGVYLTDLNIRTILTHEQFEQNAYRLEGK